MRKLLTIMAAALALTAMQGCKTTEKNYREAYEKAVDQVRENSGVDSTIYARIRNSAQTSVLVAGADTVAVRTEYIGYTDGGGMSADSIGRFSVVVGQFKQVFNARQMRKRLMEGGYPGAFIVHTREPLYYVCTSTTTDGAEAAKACLAVGRDKSIVLKKPLPFLLTPAGRRWK